MTSREPPLHPLDKDVKFLFGDMWLGKDADDLFAYRRVYFYIFSIYVGLYRIRSM